MNSLMLTMNIIMSLMFMMTLHPLTLGIILMGQTLIISMITSNLNFNSWYSYILFLIMIGGMMILFIYMTSIASNEKFKFNMKMFTLIPISLLLTMMTNKFDLMMNLTNNEMMKMNTNMMINISLNKYINFPSIMIMMFMMTYLFITLIAIVKITNLDSGPLRQKY